jgi:hypothetical protein
MREQNCSVLLVCVSQKCRGRRIFAWLYYGRGKVTYEKMEQDQVKKMAPEI